MRIHEFTIIGQSAWNEVFLFSTIKENVNGNYSLKIVEGGNVHTVVISNPEDIIQQIRTLEPIDNKFYENIWEDGYSWVLRIAYNDKEIVSGGRNATPKQLCDFMLSLGCNIGKPESIRGRRTRNMTEEERIELICNTKEFNRRHTDLWDESDIKYDLYVYESFRPGFFKVGIKSK